MKDVGHLMVKVFKAKGLASADIGGKSDPFAIGESIFQFKISPLETDKKNGQDQILTADENSTIFGQST